MTTELRDPSKPAWEIVEELPDGGAIRNDGVELQPAAQNPWYVLATVHGPGDGKFLDVDLYAENRRIWNGWACAKMDEAERTALAEAMGLDRAELAPLSDEERALAEAALRDRIGPDAKLPAPDGEINLSFTHFSKTTPVVFEKCVFSGTADFESATFSGYADFQSATFSGRAYFKSATFSGYADFQSATFSGRAYFKSATFSGFAFFQSATFSEHAVFRSATFSGTAVFESATISGGAGFRSATFSEHAVFRSATISGGAGFRSATFRGSADFQNGAFGGVTDFRRAQFGGSVPLFHQREFHQNTRFSPEPGFWPTITGVSAEDGKNAYARLRKVMNELHRPDDEHFFFRQEMRCEGFLKEGWDRAIVQGFGWLSDYGYGVVRPAALLFALWLGPALIYAFVLGSGCWAGLGASPPGCGANVLSSLFTGAGFSFANLFGFLGLQRLHFDAGFWAQLSGGLRLLAGLQTVLGFFFVFFLGLGLRNRFRLK